jgi:hypothetical protein
MTSKEAQKSPEECKWKAGLLCTHPESRSDSGTRCWCIEVLYPELECIGRTKPKICPVCGRPYLGEIGQHLTLPKGFEEKGYEAWKEQEEKKETTPGQ